MKASGQMKGKVEKKVLGEGRCVFGLCVRVRKLLRAWEGKGRHDVKEVSTFVPECWGGGGGGVSGCGREIGFPLVF